MVAMIWSVSKETPAVLRRYPAPHKRSGQVAGIRGHAVIVIRSDNITRVAVWLANLIFKHVHLELGSGFSV
jgi:hypothetical protein